MGGIFGEHSVVQQVLSPLDPSARETPTIHLVVDAVRLMAAVRCGRCRWPPPSNLVHDLGNGQAIIDGVGYHQLATFPLVIFISFCVSS